MARTGRREWLLIVGEDLTLLHVLPEAVRMHLTYVDVETSTSAASAIARLEQAPVSAVVTDLSMRFGAGFVVLNHLVSHMADTPVIVTSYRHDQRMARQAYEAGAYDVLWKPLERDEMIQSVRSAVGTYRLRQRLKSVQSSLVRLQRLLAEASERPIASEQQTDVMARSLSAAAYSYALSKRAKEAIENRLHQREQVIKRYSADLEAKVGTARRRAQTRVLQETT